MKKILGISGGRLNSTNDCMCKEALMAAKEAGCEVEFVRLNDLELKHCTGCNGCTAALFTGRGNSCVLKDDFAWLVDKMYSVDGIIFAIPIFEEGAMGMFHTIMDRFGPRMDKASCLIGEQIKPGSIDPRYLNNKICVSYMGFGGSEWTTRVQADFFIQSMTPGWKIIDNRFFDHSLNIMTDEDRIAQVHQVGLNIAKAVQTPEQAEYCSEPGVCPHCHSREFYFAENGEVVCNQCGIVGRMEITGGQPVFTFDAEKQLPLAHDVLSGKYAHMEDIQRMLGLQTEMKSTDSYKERAAAYKAFITATKPTK